VTAFFTASDSDSQTSPSQIQTCGTACKSHPSPHGDVGSGLRSRSSGSAVSDDELTFGGEWTEEVLRRRVEGCIG
jgi:hypothetical protein